MNAERDHGGPTHPQRRANLISFLLFWWTNDLFKTGNQRPLQQSDFWPLHEEDKTSLLTNQLQWQWSKDLDECSRTGKEPRLWKSAMKVLSCKDLCIISFAGLLDSVGRFLRPFFLGVFISTLMSDTPGRGLLCGYAALMLLIVLMKSIAVHHSSFKLYVIGMRMKASLKGVIFRKVSALSTGAGFSFFFQKDFFNSIDLNSYQLNRYYPHTLALSNYCRRLRLAGKMTSGMRVNSH